MNFQLACGHIFTMPVSRDNRQGWPDPSMRCTACGYRRHVKAIDVRCWHVKCITCRYGRWFDVDKAAARAAASTHIHVCMVDLAVYPPYREYVKSMYPGRVRLFIDSALGDTFDRYEYPEKPNSENEVPF